MSSGDNITKRGSSRRKFLAVASTAAAAGIAGCSSGSGGSSGGSSSAPAASKPETSAPAPAASAGLKVGSITIPSAIVTAAQAEGECLLYGAMDEPDMLDPIKPGFEEAVPGVTLKPWGGGSSEIAGKLVSEFKANIVSSDVSLYSLSTARSVGKTGVYVEYTNEHWLKQTAEELGYAPGYWRTPDAPAYELPGYGLPYALHYNTDIMSAGDVPTTYEAWTDPSYTGQNGFVLQDPRQLSSQASLMATLYGLWGEETMKTWAKGFMANKPQFTTGNSGAYNVCLSGEKALCNTYINDLVGQVAEGQDIPLAIQWIDPAMTSVVTNHITAGAPHPNAGECFAAWFMSELGQEKVADTGRAPIHAPTIAAHADFSAFIPADQVILPYAYNNPEYNGSSYITDPGAWLPLFEELF